MARTRRISKTIGAKKKGAGRPVPPQSLVFLQNSAVLNGVTDAVGGNLPQFFCFFLCSLFFFVFVFNRFPSLLRAVGLEGISSVFCFFFFAFLLEQGQATAIYWKDGEFHSDAVCTDPVQNFPTESQGLLCKCRPLNSIFLTLEMAMPYASKPYGEDPSPQDFSLTKKTTRLLRADFVLTKDPSKHYQGHSCGKLHRGWSCC